MTRTKLRVQASAEPGALPGQRATMSNTVGPPRSTYSPQRLSSPRKGLKVSTEGPSSCSLGVLTYDGAQVRSWLERGVLTGIAREKQVLRTPLVLSSVATTVSLFVLLFVVAGCAMKPDKLPPVHRAYYRMIDGPAQRNAFLEMDDREREAHAARLGFAQQWAQLSPAQQRAVLSARIAPGFDRFAVHMAWGRPADEKGLQARGRSLWLETYIRCTSGPRAKEFVYDHLECDGTSSESMVVFEADRVIEVRALD